MGGQQLFLNVESERRSGKLQRNDASASNANPGEATLPGGRTQLLRKHARIHIMQERR